MHIERLHPDAWQRLKTVRLRALADSPDAFGTTYAEADAWPDDGWKAQARDLPTFIAIDDGRDIGMVRVGGTEAEAEMISMWIDEVARGRGIADGLIEAVVAWARQSGVRRIVLEVADSNVRAIALYERLGFRRTGVTSAYPPPRAHITEHQRALAL